jgi:hypothetical protein
MIAAMRPDIDNIDEYVRNTTARAFSVVASALGIPALLPFLKARAHTAHLIERFRWAKDLSRVTEQPKLSSRHLVPHWRNERAALPQGRRTTVPAGARLAACGVMPCGTSLLAGALLCSPLGQGGPERQRAKSQAGRDGRTDRQAALRLVRQPAGSKLRCEGPLEQQTSMALPAFPYGAMHA